MQRVFLELDENGAACLPREELHHLVKVRRARPGSRFLGFHPQGCWFLCELTRTGERWGCLLLEMESQNRESMLEIHLAQSLIKQDRFEWVLQKAVELGVSRIAPLAAGRCEVRLAPERAASKAIRWNRILREAVKQCGRTRVPELAEPVSPTEFLETTNTGLGLFLDERGGEPLKVFLRSHAPLRHCSILIGPEGGWEDSERKLFLQHGLSRAHLGPRVLRAETATIAVLSVLQYEFGDL